MNRRPDTGQHSTRMLSSTDAKKWKKKNDPIEKGQGTRIAATNRDPPRKPSCLFDNHGSGQPTDNWRIKDGTQTKTPVAGR
jgi:hypothetical protein